MPPAVARQACVSWTAERAAAPQARRLPVLQHREEVEGAEEEEGEGEGESRSQARWLCGAGLASGGGAKELQPLHRCRWPLALGMASWGPLPRLWLQVLGASLSVPLASVGFLSVGIGSEDRGLCDDMG